MNKQELTIRIKEEAIKLGFAECGIAQADFLEADAQNLQAWLNKGYHAGLDYMANHFEKRTDPRLLVENCKSVIVVLLNYLPEKKQNEENPQIAYYAYGNDYHQIVKDKLHELFAFIKSISDTPVDGRVFTDSAPVLERAWAKKAGLGRIGKNTHLINTKIGSFCFIGELILDLELEYDQAISKTCGTCHRCIDACPTHALREPYLLDANRCLSYHNIESKNAIPENIKANMSNRLFGCDICQKVCPSNIGCLATSDSKLTPIQDLLNMELVDWEKISETEFNERFKNSPLKRAGYNKLMETVKILRENKNEE